jgi:predicted outer membrane repeat protein
MVTTLALAEEFVVTTDQPGGTGSLLEAVELANATPGPDTIRFDPAFFSTPRTITMEGIITPTDSLTVIGPGRDLLNIVTGSIPLLTYAGIYIRRYDGTDVQDYVWSGLTLSESPSAYASGVITSQGHNLEISDARLVGNGRVNLTPGSAIAVHSAELSLRDTLIENFNSNQGAGAVFIDVGTWTESARPLATIERSVFRDNRTPGPGGAIAVYVRASVTGSKSVLIRDSEFSENEAWRGGALYGNGAIEFSISNSTFSGNAATRESGGAISVYNDSGFSASLVIGTTTITDNETASSGGAIEAKGNAAPSVLIANSVIAGNRAGAAGAVVAQDLDVAELVTSYSLIGAAPGANPAVVITEHQAAIGSTLVDTDPMLGPLAANGGVTRTHAIRAGSPLLDAGSVNAPTRDRNISQPATDQRGAGYARVSNSSMDIGAYEHQVSGKGSGGSGGGGGDFFTLALLTLLVLLGDRHAQGRSTTSK